MAFPGSLLERLPRLRLLVASGMRTSVIDYAAARRLGVTVCGTASSTTPPVELTWALILGLARGLVAENAAPRTGGPWQSTVGADLHGRRLGLLGPGRIGSAVARVGPAFGMEMVAWSQNLTADRAEAAGVRLAPSPDGLLRTSDWVSVRLQLGDRTRGLLGARELALLQPTAYLVNTSRSALVDQAALADAAPPGRERGGGGGRVRHRAAPTGRSAAHPAAPARHPHRGYVSQDSLRRYDPRRWRTSRPSLAGEPIRLLGV